MKKKIVSALSVALALLPMTFSAAGCKSNTPSSAWIETREETVKTPTISLSETHKELLIGDEAYLTVDGENEEGYALTYRSDDETIATVTQNGCITAVGAGNATITAEYSKEGAESVSATCTVHCGFGGYRPGLAVFNTNDGALTIAEDTPFRLNAGVEFNGKSFDDVKLTYEAKNTSVVTIDETGMITPKAIGETQIVVNGVWRGVSYRDVPELSVTVPVRVQKAVVYYNDGEPFDDLTLYTVKSFNGETYATSAPCEFRVMVDGTVYDADVSIADEGIVERNGAFLNALKSGETTLTVSFDNGEISTSRTIALKVIRPEMTITQKIPMFCTNEGTWFDVETDSRKTVYDFIKANVAGAENYGNKLTEAYQGDAALSLDSNGGLNGVKSSKLQERGEANVTLCTDSVVYRLQMETLGNVIGDLNDLKALSRSGVREGYWELLNNIDAKGETIGGKGTFKGVFDGKGKTIKNFTISENGSLLGDGGGSSGCTVKNIALVNVNATRAFYFFTENNAAEAGFVMDNIYIRLSDDTVHPRGLTGYAGGANNYTNILIEYTGSNADTFRDYAEQMNYGVFIGDLPLTVPTQQDGGVKREFYHDKKVEYNWSNIYVVSPYALAFNPAQVGWNSGGDGTYCATYAYAENQTTDVYGNPIVSEGHTKTGEYTRENP
ncbi:MAG: Ig-like domain-containing protein, partial [Candidatus Scatosoma sp.]